MRPSVSPHQGRLCHDRRAPVERKDFAIVIAARALSAATLVLLAVAAAPLGACRGRVGAFAPFTKAAPAAAPAGDTALDYAPAPSLVSVARGPGGRLTLVGRGVAGGRVRLASPSGQAVFGAVGPDAIWRLVLPPVSAPRLFGLSVQTNGRTVQSEGYLALTPDGRAIQLRSGAGAVVLGAGGPEPSILAVDYDSKGGAVVSGRAAAGETLLLSVDGARKGRAAAGADGGFAIEVDEPLAFAAHRLEVAQGPIRAVVDAHLAPAAPLQGGPYRAAVAPGGGWRIDWMTPGGGLQTTLVLGAAPPGRPGALAAPAAASGASG